MLALIVLVAATVLAYELHGTPANAPAPRDSRRQCTNRRGALAAATPTSARYGTATTAQHKKLEQHDQEHDTKDREHAGTTATEEHDEETQAPKPTNNTEGKNWQDTTWEVSVTPNNESSSSESEISPNSSVKKKNETTKNSSSRYYDPHEQYFINKPDNRFFLFLNNSDKIKRKGLFGGAQIFYTQTQTSNDNKDFNASNNYIDNELPQDNHDPRYKHETYSTNQTYPDQTYPADHETFTVNGEANLTAKEESQDGAPTDFYMNDIYKMWQLMVRSMGRHVGCAHPSQEGQEIAEPETQHKATQQQNRQPENSMTNETTTTNQADAAAQAEKQHSAAGVATPPPNAASSAALHQSKGRGRWRTTQATSGLAAPPSPMESRPATHPSDTHKQQQGQRWQQQTMTSPVPDLAIRR